MAQIQTLSTFIVVFIVTLFLSFGIVYAFIVLQEGAFVTLNVIQWGQMNAFYGGFAWMSVFYSLILSASYLYNKLIDNEQSGGEIYFQETPLDKRSKI